MSDKSIFIDGYDAVNDELADEMATEDLVAEGYNPQLAAYHEQAQVYAQDTLDDLAREPIKVSFDMDKLRADIDRAVGDLGLKLSRDRKIVAALKVPVKDRTDMEVAYGALGRLIGSGFCV